MSLQAQSTHTACMDWGQKRPNMPQLRPPAHAPASALWHSVASVKPRGSQQCGQRASEMPRHGATLSPHLPPLTALPGFATFRHPSSLSPLGKEELATSTALQEERTLPLLPGAHWSCQGCVPLPPGHVRRVGKDTWGRRKAGCAYLLRVRVPVIPQARVGQHEPMFLPLQPDKAGGGKGKDRREMDRKLPGEV